MADMLQVQGLSKSFGQLAAVSDFDLEVPEGQIRCIIGPNGAGKTTLFNLITGRLKPDRGRVVLAGQDITGLSPRQVVRRRVGRSFQISNYFGNLTVWQNVRVAVLAEEKRSRVFYRPVGALAEVNARVGRVLDTFGLAPLAELPADKLSHGDRRKLELCMVMALRPRMLLLDEPTAGMNPAETDQTIALIEELVRGQGLTLLLTEHDMKVVFSLADRITFMHYGTVVCEGPPDEIRENKEVQEIYLGGEVCLS